MKIVPATMNEELKPLSQSILVALIVLPLVTVGTVRAQEDTDAVRAQVSAQDRASIYSFPTSDSMFSRRIQGGKSFRSGPNSNRYA